MAYTLVPTELIVDGAITSAKLDTNIAISGTLGVTGEVTLATHLIMGDNDKIKIGTGGDLEIYHDGSNSYISNSTGNLYLGDTNGSVHIQAKLNEESIVCASDGAVTLYHDNAVKLATSSAGVTVTGTLAATLSTAAQTNITSVGTLTGLDVAGTATMDGLTVQSTATTRPTIGNSDVNTSGLTTGLNFEPISNLTNGAKLNVISGLQPTVASAYTAGFEFVTEDHSGGGTFAQTKALTIGASGDISFYEDTGTTAKFFWDASAESLGIGTDNPSTALEVNNASAGATVATFEGTYNASGDVKLASFERSGGAVAAAITYADAATAMEFGTTTSHALILTTGDTERMRITSSGVIQSTNGTTTSEWYPSGGVQYFGTSTNHPIQFFTNNSNAMQIDTSGNLLVGTTSTSASVAGGRIFSTGRLVTSVNNEGHYFRRNSSDGTIVEFAKDSSTVGSIGTAGGGAFYISDGIYGGLGFSTLGAGDINPVNTTGGVRDAATDLGQPTARFKDLYLSGGVYLGGTGSANKLDDYEEGTWTPDLTFGGVASGISWNTQSGKYVKIGSVVHLFCLLFEAGGRGSQTGNAQLTGLPFATSSSNPDSWISLTNRSGITVSSDEQLALFLPTNTQTPTFYISRTVAGTNSTATHANFSASGIFEVSFALTYRTDS
jgi:hypothetical protein